MPILYGMPPDDTCQGVAFKAIWVLLWFWSNLDIPLPRGASADGECGESASLLSNQKWVKCRDAVYDECGQGSRAGLG